jgi:hypothetical protein
MGVVAPGGNGRKTDPRTLRREARARAVNQ